MTSAASNAASAARPITRQLRGMDGIRAVALCWGLLLHFCNHAATGTVIDQVIVSGAFGVEIFFVLSGFLITQLLLDEERRLGSISLSGFYERRAWRILPPLLFFLLCLLLLTRLGVLKVPDGDFIAGLFFYRNLVGGAPETGHLWTLAIEEQFYLCWPMLLILVRSWRLRIFGSLAIVAAAPFWEHWVWQAAVSGAHVNPLRTDLHAPALVIGGLLAMAMSAPRLKPLLQQQWLSGSGMCRFAIAFIAVGTMTPLLDLPVLRALRGTLLLLATAAVINCVIQHQQSRLTHLLEYAPLAWLGRLTYSLYIWQQLFAAQVPHIEATWFRSFPVNIMLALVMAVFSFYVVEKPLLRYRQKLRQAVRATTTAASKPVVPKASLPANRA